ncbi:lysophospholipid acyltransferase family protein [Helicobacter sp. MIT 01-3238]|uniref:lysophospholipid acyltransferase family protein n=1 Tax=Helicobacter sp. MIT 01-3238 TaxID=398627 RepID=UPI000E1F2207|nr:lysophospholipid acyltransferase family protein [Helicobacter sp. MIT 01-3238]RDU53478.1 1-acyl-sn-glycerol-3-phosphate acyltransferase [Helicobacter sp. MIT 01-3238]
MPNNLHKAITKQAKTICQKILALLFACFGFVVFGIICASGNLIFIPIIALRLHRYKKVQYFSRDLVRYAWALFLWIMRLAKRVSYSFKANESIVESAGKSKKESMIESTNKPKTTIDKISSTKPSQIIIANHPSLLDVVLLLANIARINCVVKASLSKNIFLFGAIKASGYILNTANEELLQKSIDALKSGESLLIFPEGTRTKDKISFHKAASYIATHGAKSLSAIFIKMHPKSLQKDSKWYNTPAQTLHYEILLENQIILDDFAKDKSDSLRVRALHEYLRNLYAPLNEC